MYYHFAILLLFRPLIKFRIIGSSISPRDVCCQAADAIQGLLRSYSQLYTLRRTPSFVPYFVLTSSIMHLAIGASQPASSEESQEGNAKSPASQQQQQQPGAEQERYRSEGSGSPRRTVDVAAAISGGIADLTEMAPCHHFAEQALNILRYLAMKWNIDVKIDDASSSKGGAVVSGGYREDDLENAVRPVTSSLNFFAPNVRESDFMCAWGAGGPEGMGASARAEAQTADALENPLFWPFPMQGRPMLPTGQYLEEAGFALL